MQAYPDKHFTVIGGKHYRRLRLMKMGGGLAAYLPRYLLFRLADERGLEELLELGVTEEGEAGFELIGIGADDLVKEETHDATTPQ